VQGLVSVQLAVAAANTQLTNSGDTTLAPESVQAICAESAMAASSILYHLSGQQYTGACGPVTIRPVARPTDIDTRAFGTRMFPTGYLSTWGSATAYGMAWNGAQASYGPKPSEINLGVYPVTSIDQVKIDGVIIPETEFQLENYRTLVRMRVNAETEPTQRWGWPTSAIMDLPDTEPGTFSVTYRFGVAPPPEGLIACRKLAEVMALPQFGDSTRYPQRLTSLTRQGITSAVPDVIDVLSKGSLGIWEVDAFILSSNPNRNTRRPLVFSPDRGRIRRQPAGST
jgi:hypothetical protein